MKKLSICTIILIMQSFFSCGKYPNKTMNDEHKSGAGHLIGSAEKNGTAYSPLFLQEGYNIQDVNFEVKESIVDIGKGYKYRALTFDGNFPAKTISIRKNTLVRIKLTNKGKEAHSIHTHVIKYKPESDGTLNSATLPGETRYYFWEVTSDTPAGFYPFHDHGGEGESALSRGLIGTVEVLDEGAKPGFAILLHDLDPKYLFSTSGYPVVEAGGGDHSAGHGGGGSAATGNQPAHLINGRIGDNPASNFSVKQGEKLSLGVVNLGENIHNFHPHGNFYKDSSGKINDVLEVQPGAYQTVELIAETKGKWMYHCHVPGHPEGGMWSNYEVY
jgi:FtsP/CotA-like multicopper oxidase with cupredoxin domain